MANVRTRLRRAAVVLFTDSEVFQKNITGCRTLEDIKSQMHIKGRVYKSKDYGDTLGYKLADSDYYFEIRFINERSGV